MTCALLTEAVDTRKICVAVNNNASLPFAPCGRLRDTVCGFSTAARVRPTQTVGADLKGNFGGSILQQEKAVLSTPHTSARNADRELRLMSAKGPLRPAAGPSPGSW